MTIAPVMQMFNRQLRRLSLQQRRSQLVWVLVATAALGGSLIVNAEHTVDPIAFHTHVMNNSGLYTTLGEQFTWHAAYDIDGYVDGYLAFQDTRWLDQAVKYYDWLIDQMAVEPDGYKGWVGPHITAADRWGSAIVGDANLIAPMLRFAEVVYRDPALRSLYQERADCYIELAKHIIEKWDARGSWVEDGRYGQYVQQTLWALPDSPESFTDFPDMKRTENLNKSGKMGTVLLRLYRILGHVEYKERAEKILGHYKRIMRYDPKDNRYIRNFWEPFGPWDMTIIPQGWVDVHPSRPTYQASETAMMVEAYHTGVVFDAEDMQRILNTNLWMWNGAYDRPAFTSADGRTDAGVLWPALVDFDERLRVLYEHELRANPSIRNRIQLAYLQRVTMNEPAGFARKFVSEDVALPEITVFPSTGISMAVAIPSRINRAEKDRMVISSQVREEGALLVDLYADDGVTLIDRLLSVHINRIDTFSSQVWLGHLSNGELVDAGRYYIRWTLNDSRRQVEIEVE